MSGNVQFIISIHLPILMSFPNAEILCINGDKISKVDWKDTEHYIITKSFLDHPNKYFKYLFG